MVVFWIDKANAALLNSIEVLNNEIADGGTGYDEFMKLLFSG